MMKGWKDPPWTEFGVMPPGCRVVNAEGHASFQRTQLERVWVMEMSYCPRVRAENRCLISSIKKKQTPMETQREVTGSSIV